MTAALLLQLRHYDILAYLKISFLIMVVIKALLLSEGSAQTHDNVRQNEAFHTPFHFGNIHLSNSGRKLDGKLYYCQIDWVKVSEAPHDYSMWEKVVSLSGCGINSAPALLSQQIAFLTKNNIRSIYPTGFIFHEGRVGSTLISNMLATDKNTMMFSEPLSVFSEMLNLYGAQIDGRKVTRSIVINAIRDIFRVLGASPYHTRMFMKFTDGQTMLQDLFLDAFPETPWIFIYRDPVQTIMSSLLGDRLVGPCGVDYEGKNIGWNQNDFKLFNKFNTEAAHCSVNLRRYRMKALDGYSNYSKYSQTSKQRGMFVNYDSIPGILPTVILPMFDLKISKIWAHNMKIESRVYSKSTYSTVNAHERTVVNGTTTFLFKEDSLKKDIDAAKSRSVKIASDSLLKAIHDEMDRKALNDIHVLNPNLYSRLTDNGFINWKILKNYYKTNNALV